MKSLTKRLFLLSFLALALFAAACSSGGSSSGPPPPPPVGNFSNASLNGLYAFSMSGSELVGTQSGFFARIGTFVADGSGHITDGVEDVNVSSGASTLRFTGGAYSIQADGRGSLSLTNITGTTNYSITLTSPSQGFIIQTDGSATAGGSFQKQDLSAFSQAGISGDYVFDFSGISRNLNPESFIGRFSADGGGAILNGRFDDNEAGTPSGPFAFTGGYTLDPTFGGSFGRGTANLANRSFVFYIVDRVRVKFLSSSIDFPAALLGDAVAQQSISFNLSSLNGSYAFLIGGASTAGAIATAGRFTADGNGNLGTVVLDENNSGGITPLNNASGSYTVDADGLGGGTATFTDPVAGTFSFVFYLVSPTQAVFQETDNSITSDGSLLAQSNSSFSLAGLAGAFAFGWSGVSINNGVIDEEDFVGQFKLTSASTSNLTGATDFNEFSAGKLFFDVVINGALTVNSSGTGRNTLSVNLQTSPSNHINFSAYVVSPNAVFLLGTDGNRVIAGTVARQP